MRALARTIAVVVCLAALLLALPAQAATPQTPKGQTARAESSILARIVELWERLGHLLNSVGAKSTSTTTPVTPGSNSTDGSSCIDPYGCTTSTY